jgi:hypothetical protein
VPSQSITDRGVSTGVSALLDPLKSAIRIAVVNALLFNATTQLFRDQIYWLTGLNLIWCEFRPKKWPDVGVSDQAYES